MVEFNGVIVRLAIESFAGRQYFDECEDTEDMNVAVTYLQAKAMQMTKEDGIERMVGFVVSKKEFNPENN